MGRLVPWSSWDEWREVRGWLLLADIAGWRQGMQRVAAWRARGKVPLGVDITACLREAQLCEEPPQFQSASVLDSAATAARLSTSAAASSEQHLRTAYCMPLIRMVNGISDSQQRGKVAASISSLSTQAGLPKLLVDVRHDATHGELPTLPLLRLAVSQALVWLQQYYWDAQLNQLLSSNARISQLLTWLSDSWIAAALKSSSAATVACNGGGNEPSDGEDIAVDAVAEYSGATGQMQRKLWMSELRALVPCPWTSQLLPALLDEGVMGPPPPPALPSPTTVSAHSTAHINAAQPPQLLSTAGAAAVRSATNAPAAAASASQQGNGASLYGNGNGSSSVDPSSAVAAGAGAEAAAARRQVWDALPPAVAELAWKNGMHHILRYYPSARPQLLQAAISRLAAPCNCHSITLTAETGAHNESSSSQKRKRCHHDQHISSNSCSHGLLSYSQWVLRLLPPPPPPPVVIAPRKALTAEASALHSDGRGGGGLSMDATAARGNGTNHVGSTIDGGTDIAAGNGHKGKKRGAAVAAMGSTNSPSAKVARTGVAAGAVGFGTFNFVGGDHLAASGGLSQLPSLPLQRSAEPPLTLVQLCQVLQQALQAHAAVSSRVAAVADAADQHTAPTGLSSEAIMQDNTELLRLQQLVCVIKAAARAVTAALAAAHSIVSDLEKDQLASSQQPEVSGCDSSVPNCSTGTIAAKEQASLLHSHASKLLGLACLVTGAVKAASRTPTETSRQILGLNGSRGSNLRNDTSISPDTASAPSAVTSIGAMAAADALAQARQLRAHVQQLATVKRQQLCTTAAVSTARLMPQARASLAPQVVVNATALSWQASPHPPLIWSRATDWQACAIGCLPGALTPSGSLPHLQAGLDLSSHQQPDHFTLPHEQKLQAAGIAHLEHPAVNDSQPHAVETPRLDAKQMQQQPESAQLPPILTSHDQPASCAHALNAASSCARVDSTEALTSAGPAADLQDSMLTTSGRQDQTAHHAQGAAGEVPVSGHADSSAQQMTSLAVDSAGAAAAADDAHPLHIADVCVRSSIGFL